MNVFAGRIVSRRSLIVVSAVIFLVVLFNNLPAIPHPDGLSIPNPLPTNRSGQQTTPHDKSAHSDRPPDPPRLPDEYAEAPVQSDYCAAHFGRKYLDDLRDTPGDYCAPSSPSALRCFHSTTAPDGRVDSTCVGGPARLDLPRRRFVLGCERRKPEGVPDFEHLGEYWYGTGPRNVFKSAVDLASPAEAGKPEKTGNFTILMKREGAGNTWHSMMEFMAMGSTLDLLRTTVDPATRQVFLSEADAENTRVVVLDEHEDGPYWDLWNVFAKRPTVRMKDIKEEGVERLIVPLAGGSNPIWQGDWEVHNCRQSGYLRAFVSRVLKFYKIETAERSGDVVVTFVDRKGGRKLVNQEALLAVAQEKLPHVKVQSIDFASIPFSQQIQTVRDSDVLLGVHGAGLTHGMWLRQGSAIVEILPQVLNHKGFRNLAGLLGHGYFSAHGKKPGGKPGKVRRDEWHHQDVAIDEARFLDLVESAVNSMKNKGMRNLDVS